MPRTYSAMHLYRSSVGRSGRSPCRLHTLATLLPVDRQSDHSVDN